MILLINLPGFFGFAMPTKVRIKMDFLVFSSEFLWDLFRSFFQFLSLDGYP